MKNLIYQFWDGKLTDACKAGVENLKIYAERIGAEHVFEHNPRFITNLGYYSPHYGAFKPAYTEKYHEYDNIMFADTDIFALDGITDNVFEEFQKFSADIGICTEPLQPILRSRTDSNIANAAYEKIWAAAIKNKWNVDLPKNKEGLLKVYNSGIVLYSNNGLKTVRDKFKSFLEYIDLVKKSKLSIFYQGDQNYLHAMLFVCGVDYIELDNEWNRYITYAGITKPKTKICDPRTENTKFVHIQMRGADHYNAEQLWRITNLPVEQWGLDRVGNPFVRGDCLTGGDINKNDL
ncbi:hypothetical protein LCGC14_1618490 [marine sediment metagenome]|uniref:Nucleotide-diphospho-sugar transferase domain-containing protein n=1 Tax=marine sediment metagenome TaxID=412755 RepID=A0A0F9I6H2_9ZZZZ